jgi:hypothetical protein
MTASFRASLAASNPATSSHFTPGFSFNIAAEKKRKKEKEKKRWIK